MLVKQLQVPRRPTASADRLWRDLHEMLIHILVVLQGFHGVKLLLFSVWREQGLQQQSCQMASLVRTRSLLHQQLPEGA